MTTLERCATVPQILLFEPRHLFEIEAREFDRHGLMAYGREHLEQVAMICAKQPAYTAFTEDGRIVGCAGVIVQRQGIADGWAVTSALITDYGIWSTRIVKSMLQEIMCSLNLRRVQISVDPQNVAAQRWAKALGFQYEGTMRGFGVNGEPYDLYAKVMP